MVAGDIMNLQAAVNAEPEGCKYRRIYYQTGFPGTLAISGNALNRKQQDPKNCTTVGWVAVAPDGKVRVLA